MDEFKNRLSLLWKGRFGHGELLCLNTPDCLSFKFKIYLMTVCSQSPQPMCMLNQMALLIIVLFMIINNYFFISIIYSDLVTQFNLSVDGKSFNSRNMNVYSS